MIAVVIPSYKVTRHILSVIAGIGAEVSWIFVVDDCCPDGSGRLVQENCKDPRVRVIFHDVNRGVGGAVKTGYQAGIHAGATVLVKLDGDGQMDPQLISAFVAPILRGDADYTKGNRFWDLREIGSMPLVRRGGNLGLSFLSKLSTGYWNVFDPTNGYTAIHASVADRLPFRSISDRYFFETDMLFRLNTIRAVACDIPMHSRYADEVSGFNAGSMVFEFSVKHMRNFIKRIFYNYFLRDLSLASLELVAGIVLVAFGMVFGVGNWWASAAAGTETPVGTIMVVTVAMISGLQFLLAFFGYDIANVPNKPFHLLIKGINWPTPEAPRQGEKIRDEAR